MLALVAAAALLSAALAMAAKKKKDPAEEEEEEEPKTQILEVLPDPPPAAYGETSRLVFDVAPLSAKGLLSQQVRDALKALSRSPKKGRAIRLRAFVAGSGDMRRVQAVVSEVFAGKRLPLPTLSVVQVGELPLKGAQVLLESVGETKKQVNPHGLAFISGQEVVAKQETTQVAPLGIESLKKVLQAAETVGSTAKDVLRVTCYASSLEDGPELHKAMVSAFPGAALSHVQLRRTYTHGSVCCEAVARLTRAPGDLLRLENPSGLENAPHRSEIALVSARRVVLTGSQLAFRHQDADIKLAFERLGKVLEESKTSYGQVVQASLYPISMALADRIWTFGFERLDKARPPASTITEFEGLPSLDASFGVDVIAIAPPQATPPSR